MRVGEVPVCVKKAYAARKKEQAQRCRRALRRSLTCSSTFDAIDSDAQMAWKARLAESQAFVASLQTPNMYADANSTGVRVKAKLRKATFGRAVQNGPGGTWHTSFCLSDRKFSKTKRCRKNGIANSSERRRIPSPKTTRLQQEADAAERNEASVRLVLQELPSWLKDRMYVASFQDARRMLAMRYRHKSNTVLGRIVLSIHETGHLRRRKMKGCGSFNLYGSEGPVSFLLASAALTSSHPELAGSMAVTILRGQKPRQLNNLCVQMRALGRGGPASSVLVPADEVVPSSSPSSSSVRRFSPTPDWLFQGVQGDFSSLHSVRPGLGLPSMSDSDGFGIFAKQLLRKAWETTRLYDGATMRAGNLKPYESRDEVSKIFIRRPNSASTKSSAKH